MMVKKEFKSQQGTKFVLDEEGGIYIPIFNLAGKFLYEEGNLLVTDIEKGGKRVKISVNNNDVELMKMLSEIQKKIEEERRRKAEEKMKMKEINAMEIIPIEKIGEKYLVRFRGKDYLISAWSDEERRNYNISADDSVFSVKGRAENWLINMPWENFQKMFEKSRKS